MKCNGWHHVTANVWLVRPDKPEWMVDDIAKLGCAEARHACVTTTIQTSQYIHCRAGESTHTQTRVKKHVTPRALGLNRGDRSAWPQGQSLIAVAVFTVWLCAVAFGEWTPLAPPSGGEPRLGRPLGATCERGQTWPPGADHCADRLLREPATVSWQHF